MTKKTNAMFSDLLAYANFCVLHLLFIDFVQDGRLHNIFLTTNYSNSTSSTMMMNEGSNSYMKTVTQAKERFGPENPLIDSVRHLDNFHGYLPEQDIEKMVYLDGDFAFYMFVNTVTLTLRCNRKIYRLVLETNGNKIWVENQGQQFASIEELITYGKTRGLIVGIAMLAKLKRPVGQQLWEFRMDQIQVGELIGSSLSSRVFVGELIKSNINKQQVVIKLATEPDETESLFHQCRLVRKYIHPNIIRLQGVIAKSIPPMIVMELASGGNLIDNLKNMKQQLTDVDLARYCLEIATGMEYLHSKQCIHRSLIAKNCLLGEQNKIKISGFAHSVEGGFYRKKKKDGIATKWSAPETFVETVYTDRTDVWSFGVVLWEIWSEGKEPYPGMKIADVKQRVINGYRLNIPTRTIVDMETIINDCWQTNAGKRPPFIRIKSQLDQILRYLSIQQKIQH